MHRSVAKELIHIHTWLTIAEEIVRQGERQYLDDFVLQEAGDSIMMKLGEAAKRLAQKELAEPAGVEWAIAVANRNFLVHQYDEINRAMTWRTLAGDLPKWRNALDPLISEAKSLFPAAGG